MIDSFSSSKQSKQYASLLSLLAKIEWEMMFDLLTTKVALSLSLHQLLLSTPIPKGSVNFLQLVSGFPRTYQVRNSSFLEDPTTFSLLSINTFTINRCLVSTNCHIFPSIKSLLGVVGTYVSHLGHGRLRLCFPPQRRVYLENSIWTVVTRGSTKWHTGMHITQQHWLASETTENLYN